MVSIEGLNRDRNDKVRGRESRGTKATPPAVILGTPVVHAEGGTTGVSGIQRNEGNHLGITLNINRNPRHCPACSGQSSKKEYYFPIYPCPPTPSASKQAGIQRNEGHNLVVITGADDEGDTARSSGLPGASRAMTGWGEMTVGATGDIHWIPPSLILTGWN